MSDLELLITNFETFFSSSAWSERARLLEQIRDELEEISAADQRSTATLEESLKGSTGAIEAERAALASREEERDAAQALLPRILSLQRYLTDTSIAEDREAHRLLQKAVDVAFGYIGGYPDVRDHLIRLDTEHQATAETVLRARPVAGEIDHLALSREFMARYPKLRAALAR